MKRTLITISVIFAALIFIQAAHAETLSGQITVAMKDNPVSDARVVLQDTEGTTVATVSTDQAGRFLIGNVEPGTYRITVFSPMQAIQLAEEIISVKSGEQTKIDFEVGSRRSLWGQTMSPRYM
jgi:hypothetical protein